jgi:GxxExxY protein
MSHGFSRIFADQDRRHHVNLLVMKPTSLGLKGTKVGQYYADLVVEGVVLLELKAARTLDSAHEAQLLHYLRATTIEVGLLLNFGMRPQFRRLLFDNERKKIRENPYESVAKVSS